jgi:hypothetical protein
MDCKISVIIPELSERAAAVRSLNTLLRQSHKELEIIIAGIGEDAAEVAGRYQAEHGQITACRGVPAALAAAQGECVLFYEQHAVLALTAVQALAAQAGEAGVVCCRSAVRDAEGGFARYERVAREDGQAVLSILAQGTLYSCLIRKTALEAALAAGEAERMAYAADAEQAALLLACALQAGAAFIPEVLVYSERAPESAGVAAALETYCKMARMLSERGQMPVNYALFSWYVLPFFTAFEQDAYPNNAEVLVLLQKYHAIFQGDADFMAFFDIALPGRGPLYRSFPYGALAGALSACRPSELVARLPQAELREGFLRQMLDEFFLAKKRQGELGAAVAESLAGLAGLGERLEALGGRVDALAAGGCQHAPTRDAEAAAPSLQQRLLVRRQLEQAASARYRMGCRAAETLRNPLKVFLWPSWIACAPKPGGLAREADIRRYLARLDEMKRECLIAVAVRDTPGLALDEEIAQGLLHLGLTVSLRGKHWRSYIGVLDAGNAAHEALGAAEGDALFWAAAAGGLALEVESRSYPSGDLASIKIDGIDYAVNGRGLNIVVARKNSRLPIDSVCFDTHLPGFACSRW